MVFLVFSQGFKIFSKVFLGFQGFSILVMFFLSFFSFSRVL